VDVPRLTSTSIRIGTCSPLLGPTRRGRQGDDAHSWVRHRRPWLAKDPCLEVIELERSVQQPLWRSLFWDNSPVRNSRRVFLIFFVRGSSLPVDRNHFETDPNVFQIQAFQQMGKCLTLTGVLVTFLHNVQRREQRRGILSNYLVRSLLSQGSVV
jgi:hypothetical protein